MNRKWLAIALYSLLLLVLGALASKNAILFKLRHTITNGYEVSTKYIKGLTARPEKIYIDIKYKDLQQIAYKREIALAQGMLFTDAEDFVPAEITHNGKTVRVRMRLKGDMPDHWDTDKWSFRIRVRGDNSILGMKNFSIQHPKTRNYINEWIYHETLKREGIVTLRYLFVNVHLNGKNLGVYALEEHFDKLLIEHNQMREGPIIKLDEDLVWTDRHRTGWTKFLTGLQSPHTLDINAFKMNTILSDTTLYKEFITGCHLLESFRRKHLTTSQVFDIEKLAKFFALSDLFGATHSVGWHNIRFYYNPVTSLLEPIGFDAEPHEIEHIVGSSHYVISFDVNFRIFNELFFEDEPFFVRYIECLEKYAERSYVDNLFSELEHKLNENLKILYSEFIYYRFSRQFIYKNQNMIKNALNPIKAVRANYRQTERDRLALNLANIQVMPLEVLYLSFQDSVLCPPRERITLEPKKFTEPVCYHCCNFILPDNFMPSDITVPDLKVHYRILGSKHVRTEPVAARPYLCASNVEKDFMREKSDIDDFEFLTVSREEHAIYFKPGKWTLTKNLIIPKGFSVFADETLELDIVNAAKILSYSPVTFVGTEENAITIYSSDSTGQGIVVMNAGRESTFRHVHFINLSNPSQGNWELLGAVNFYESNVSISHCSFRENRCEDALNIIRSNYEIAHSLFKDTPYDAFDGDFTNGVISNSSFVNCGNDGIDVSGSYLELHHITIKNAGDKGISVGEDSRMTGDNITIFDSEIGITGKDFSEVKLSDVTMNDTNIGFAAFQKKPEFGPATIDITRLTINNITKPYLIESGSMLTVDGRRIVQNLEKVAEIIYGAE